MTGSPGHGLLSHSGMRRIRKETGSFSSSTEKKRQIHLLEIAFPNGGRGQLHASDVHTRFGVGG